MERRITALALACLMGCSGGSGVLGVFESSGPGLNYAQYRSLEQGMRAQAVLRAFGPAASALEQDGKVRGLTYPCRDASGGLTELRMVFDEEESLKSWALRGEASPPGTSP